jgi:malonyl CoA-acyl carrier protein transacylase
MATYTITINEKTRAGKKLVALLESLNEVVSFSEVRKNKGLDEALEDVKHNRVYEAENAKDLINKCLS